METASFYGKYEDVELVVGGACDDVDTPFEQTEENIWDEPGETNGDGPCSAMPIARY